LRLYKKHKFEDFAKTKLLVFERCKNVLGENVEVVVLKNMKAWMSFFMLEKRRKKENYLSG